MLEEEDDDDEEEEAEEDDEDEDVLLQLRLSLLMPLSDCGLQLVSD